MGVGLEERGIVAILRVQPTAGSAFVDGRPICARSKRSQEEKDFATSVSNNVLYVYIYIYICFFSLLWEVLERTQERSK
jgi:hypothetical protein